MAEIALNLTKEDGSVEQEAVSLSDTKLNFYHRRLAAVSDNIAQLTHVTKLRMADNAFAEIPSGVLAMTQLTWLDVSNCGLVVIPREIGRLTALTHLYLDDNKIAALPRDIGQLHVLKRLVLRDNALTTVPAEFGQLRSLQWLLLQRNLLAWLPLALDRLPATTEVYLRSNPLPASAGNAPPLTDQRDQLPEIFAATTALAMIREEATATAIGLQDLELPALVTLEIIDAAFPNSIPMHKKWDLVVAVKHFHERRAQS